MENDVFVATEKPRNGLAGLKHWRHDLLAGLVVSMISVPFSLGIAVASGAPPICGLISAIIAGLVLPFLGGSYVTISGPAAGLAPALLAAMIVLGRGNLVTGYPLLLVAICLTGLVQIVLAKLKAARFSSLFPSSVVEGMLASIGLLIIAKEFPLLVGRKFEAHEFWAILAEIPSQLLRMEPKIFLLGTATLALIFLLAALKTRWLKVVPPQVIAAVFALVAARFMGLDAQYLVQLPDKPFEHGLVLPNFLGVLADHTLWGAIFTTVLTLTLIDGVESLATIAAVDKIDPFRRKSNPNRTLFAMGVSNMCSSMAGGLTIIPGGVKSTACIVGGGRTQWANFYNAMFLIFYIAVGRNVINMMPLSALGAIVIYTGYKLCAPKVWKHIAHIGGEQLFVFTATVLATLTTDLLWGIAVGMLVKLALEIWMASRVERPEGREGLAFRVLRYGKQAVELFRNPVVQSVSTPEGYHLYFARPLVCFNALHLSRALEQIPASASAVYFHVTDLVTLVDHTTTTTLLEFIEDFKASGRGVAKILGLERLNARSHDRRCMRTSPPILAEERSKALQAMSRLSLTAESMKSTDLVRELDHLSLTTHDSAVPAAVDHPIADLVGGAGSLLWAKVRGAFAVARPAFAAVDVSGTDRDLHKMSLCHSTNEPHDAAASLSVLGLVAPDAPAADSTDDDFLDSTWRTLL
ncbi:MAG: SulP family inorganic anion transporter [Isosphaeraceae bacterium]|nr:SulP family inorganic anion transporter [Isosphaeraceae bacterium]